jgi:NAD(P)H-flavin reductase
MLNLFWHCDVSVYVRNACETYTNFVLLFSQYTLTSWHYFIATAAVYIPCFVYPWLRTVFEYKWTQQAHIFIEDNGFTRITVPAKFHWTTAQHCFLRFTGFGVLQAISTHPFTICSSPQTSKGEQSELVFYIRHQGGFTTKLYQYALNHPEGVSVPVIIDGPYGGAKPSRLRDADHLLVIAGGSGAGWCLPFIESFIRSALNPGDEEQGNGGTSEKRTICSRSSRPTSLRVVLATRDTSSRLWFERTVDALLAKYSTSTVASSVLVHVYLTGEAADQAELSKKTPHQTQLQGSSSSDDKIIDPEKGLATIVPGSEFESRPQLPSIVQEEATKATEVGESLSVYVCGPATMQNDVRNAVASENLKILSGARNGSIYLHSEYFEWA